MPGKCSLDDCQLAAQVDGIAVQVAKIPAMEKTLEGAADNAQETRDSQNKMTQKLDDYIAHGTKEHDILFDRTRGAVTWKGLGTAAALVITGSGTLTAIIFGILHLAAYQ
ncbi:hypothetical protein KAR91_19590 [Candidatus Pacearchaeota archaeon]|nr:hypothetical protein [Candidatus Pacearchaeota archaeon]